jgi:ABC-2 type transport system permease protein
MDMLRFILSVAWKEIQLIVKDRGALAVMFLLPILLASLIAAPNVMFAEEQSESAILLDVCLVNQDPGSFGTEVAKAVQEIKQLSIETFDNVAGAEDRVARGQATAAIVIPANFSASIDAYTPTSIEVIVDPAEPESSSIVSGIMNQVVAEVTIWGEVQYGIRSVLEQSDLLADATPQERRAMEAQNLGVIMTRLNEMRRNPLIAVVSEDLAGAESDPNWVLKYLAYVFPAFTVMFIFFIVQISATSLLQERETGVLRRLAAAPIPHAAVIIGKMLAYMVVACLQVVVLLGLARAAFGVPLGESPLALVVLTLVTALVATALGMLLGTVAKSSKQAETLGYLLSFVMAGVGGSIPIGPTTMFFRAGGLMGILARLTPHGHAVDAFNRIMAEGASLTQVLPQVGILLAMGIVFFGIAVSRFKFQS